jgi:hypothetical protein
MANIAENCDDNIDPWSRDKKDGNICAIHYSLSGGIKFKILATPGSKSSQFQIYSKLCYIFS